MKKRRFTRIFADYKFQCESNLRESAKICVSKQFVLLAPSK